MMSNIRFQDKFRAVMDVIIPKNGARAELVHGGGVREPIMGWHDPIVGLGPRLVFRAEVQI